ncbi:uncharacterized protein LOC108161659 [Drosophila miranda]|uniref:uncharacterized protein LOC108161659 n=1 Tax=Drosophila miranda TaxID=7229 RepID=UPI0007E78972|nr:uncharacterized protein LOC108161659 [Drosophila miranda]
MLRAIAMMPLLFRRVDNVASRPQQQEPVMDGGIARSRPWEILSAIHRSYDAESNAGFNFETQDLCTLRFATNRVVSDLPPPDGVLSNHYRGVFETDRSLSQTNRIRAGQRTPCKI